MQNLVLASQSPRRKQLLEWAELKFDVIVKHTEETFPSEMTPGEAAVHLARHKATKVRDSEIFRRYESNAVILAADTLVVLDNEILGKPKDREDAISILTLLSGKKHEVITGVVLLRDSREVALLDSTEVHFYELDRSMIEYYVDHYAPYDKAGAYAIQEWIGVVGIRSIKGDFYNVMGLPISRVIRELASIMEN